MSTRPLSRRWLNPPPVVNRGIYTLITAFLHEAPITDWSMFTLEDAIDTLNYLIHYVVFESLDYDDDDGPPN